MLKFIFLLVCLCSELWAFDHEHKAFTLVLSKTVTRVGNQTLVDYRSLKNNPAELKTYLKNLSDLSQREFASMTKEERLATLINAYNGHTLLLVAQNYPVKSIRDIGPFYSTPWKKDFISWQGKDVSLDHLEHDLIRKDFQEPRIHFALVCAAMSCPNLRTSAYSSQGLEKELSLAADEFLKDPKKNWPEVKDASSILHVSSIFKWYGDDFGRPEKQKSFLIEHMGLKEKLGTKTVTLDFLDYDWSLNEKK